MVKVRVGSEERFAKDECFIVTVALTNALRGCRTFLTVPITDVMLTNTLSVILNYIITQPSRRSSACISSRCSLPSLSAFSEQELEITAKLPTHKPLQMTPP